MTEKSWTDFFSILLVSPIVPANSSLSHGGTKVLKMGDPLLYQRAEEVRAFHTPDLDALIRDMFDTMVALNGAGLAAPQIGVSQRVVIFEVQSNPRYPEAEAVPRTILINPVLEPIGGRWTTVGKAA